jgi:hypothetical protein
VAGQVGGGRTIQQPDQPASPRAHERGRQLSVGLLSWFEDPLKDRGFAVTAGEEQYHTRVIDHT